MDIFKDEIDPEINKIKDKLSSNLEINLEDMKIILLNLLNEEDSHESNQQ